jgi:membrane protein insertase Oxa1/YidC/SpoIIIJ
MWSDLAALTPPLIVCVAFLVGVAMFLRNQMSPKRREARNLRRRSRDRRS